MARNSNNVSTATRNPDGRPVFGSKMGRGFLDGRRVKNILQQIDGLMGQSNLTLNGSDRTSDIETLDNTFHDIMKTEIDKITNNNTMDTTSFLSTLYSNDRVENAQTSRFVDSMNGFGNGFAGDSTASAMNSFLEGVYRNRLMQQSDLHQVSSQLIELQEAILITRDAIISPDIIEGRMNRTLEFEGADDKEDWVPVVEQMETKFKLLEKIKNFIVPFSLEYGEFYVYCIPYSKLFSDFMRNKRDIINGAGGVKGYGEATSLYESVVGEEPAQTKQVRAKRVKNNTWLEQAYTHYMESTEFSSGKKPNTVSRNFGSAGDQTLKDAFYEDASNILERIEINNDPVGLPIGEEGTASFEKFADNYFTEHGYTESVEEMMTEADKPTARINSKGQRVATINLKNPANKKKKLNPFDAIQQNRSVEGAYGIDKNDTEFEDLKDVYIQMIDPTKIIPVEVMNEVIGYYIVYAEETTQMSGVISSNLAFQGVNSPANCVTFIDDICERIVRSFDKPFLENNVKFKKLIVNAINYFNVTQNRIKFQYVPVEYIQTFKIDEDIDGHGQSMVKKSLFYAKMYQMLLMFKIMSIILYSNDTRVNYVKQSGLRKDVANKIEEIIRRKQSRQINMYDLYNYSTLINKIGAGSEMYVPTGRTSERPIETEILAGQDVQLNSELLEMLKNAYILGTGVPAAIVNYLNEPEFAKIAEQNNSKWMGRVVNYQLDFNPSITELYKKIMKWATNIPEEVVDKFKFTLQAPKTTPQVAKNDIIQTFDGMMQFYIKLCLGENYDPQDRNNQLIIRNFTSLVAEEYLPQLGLAHVLDLYEEAKIKATEDSLKPNPANGDSDDMGDISDEDLNNVDFSKLT